MRTRKSGEFVFVKDANLLRMSFNSWPPCQVFRVSEHAKSNGKWYLWLESYSTGISPAAATKATKEQIATYLQEIKRKLSIRGVDGVLMKNYKEVKKEVKVNVKNRDLRTMTVYEAKEVLKLELSQDKFPNPTRIRLEDKTEYGYCFIVYTKKFMPSRQCIDFYGRKCFKTYEYLLKKDFDLTH